MWMSDGMSIKMVCVAQWNSRNDAGKVLWFPFLGLASPQNLWLNHWAIWKYLNVCILSSYDWIDFAWTFRKAIDKCVWLLWQRSCLNWITGQRGRVWMSFILKVSSFQWEIYWMQCSQPILATHGFRVCLCWLGNVNWVNAFIVSLPKVSPVRWGMLRRTEWFKRSRKKAFTKILWKLQIIMIVIYAQLRYKSSKCHLKAYKSPSRQ